MDWMLWGWIAIGVLLLSLGLGLFIASVLALNKGTEDLQDWDDTGWRDVQDAKHRERAS